MKRYYPLIIIIGLFLWSCEKEDKPNDAAGKTLNKVVTKQGSDSTVTTYVFIGNEKLAELTDLSSSGDRSSLVFTRDAQRRINRIHEVYQDAGSSPDSSEYDFFYQGSADPKVRNSKTWIEDFTQTFSDSTAYSYNGNFVSRTSHYYSASGINTVLVYYYEYTFDSRGNMNSVRLMEDGSGAGNFMEMGKIQFDFDDKINPAYSKDDALVEYLSNQFVSPNNVTRITLTSPNPGSNFIATITYEYNSDGRPLRSTRTMMGLTTTNAYYYK